MSKSGPLCAVFALRFQNLPARNSSLKIFKHEKEEKLAGPKGKLAGPAQFLVAEGLGPALNAKTVCDDIDHLILREECHDLELYKKLVAFVMAYSFTEPKSAPEDDDEEDDDDDDEDEVTPRIPMMVPMADMLNHIAKNNARLDFGEESLKMVAIKAIKKVSKQKGCQDRF